MGMGKNVKADMHVTLLPAAYVVGHLCVYILLTEKDQLWFMVYLEVPFH